MIATTHIHKANKKGNESEKESGEKEEITKVKPGEPKPVWEGVERGRNDDLKINETPHDKRLLQANSPIQDSYRVRKKGAFEAGNDLRAVKDVGNGNPEQKDRLEKQSKKRGTPPQRTADSIIGKARGENSHVPEEGGEEERGEVKKRPSIIIGIQLDRMGKTLAQFHTTFGSKDNSKRGKQGENDKKDSQDEAPYIRAPGQPHTKGL